MTYRDLASICGVSPQNVQRWKTGGTIMPEHLNQLAAYLNTSVDYLMNGDAGEHGAPANLREEGGRSYHSRNIPAESRLTIESELAFMRDEIAILRTEKNQLLEALKAALALIPKPKE